MISVTGYWASTGRFCNRSRHFANAQNLVSIRCGNFLTTLLFFLFFIIQFVNAVRCYYTDVYLNSVWFKDIDSSCHFLELNCRGLNLDFLKLKQLLLGGHIVSNPESTQNDCKSPVGHLKFLKEQQKSVVIMKTMLMLLVNEKYKLFFQYSSTSQFRH